MRPGRSDMAGILKFLFSIGTGVLSSLAGGFVLMKYLQWFINPKFSAFPTLNYLDCIGLMLVVCLFSIRNKFYALPTNKKAVEKKKLEEDEDTMGSFLVKNIVIVVAVYPGMLLAGYIWHQFI